jgi:1-phosphofructokinase/tagatose 6-phosphate kinase
MRQVALVRVALACKEMIITVTLNAAIDKTLAVPNFRLGRRHRAVEQTSMAGGKGVNVARALKALGQPVIATGMAGGPTGTRIIEALTDEAILNDFVRIREESRMSTAVVDPTSGDQTEINERGPTVSEAELELFVDKLLYLAQGAALCVFSGSLPRGVDSGLYARLVEGLRKLDVTTVLDAEGDPLRLATRAAPSVVSPNELEAEELVGHEFADDEDRRLAVQEMVDLGAREAIMTQPAGALALLGDDADAARPRRLCRATFAPLEPVSSVGSGDAFLAGYVAARYDGRRDVDCLRFGVACGAESTQHFGAGVIDPREAHRLTDEVEVEETEVAAIEAAR